MLAALVAVMPVASFAIGDEDETPPKTTPTTATCKATQIWDEKTKTCVDAQDSRFDDGQRYEGVRELAYALHLERALGVLSTMSNQQDARVLTYRGFIARKSGKMQDALAFYAAALEVDAENILTRSYLGQGFVTMGRTKEARQQLDRIRELGGAGSWAETSLARALETGQTYGY
ncbi:MAG: tetratricopeptide repeat protein [Litoreibacter sp.]|nr:tetratricopeptide repeat protein [Litoreibacter sp.]